MSQEHGTLPLPVAEGLASGLEQTMQTALTALRSGLGGAQAALQGLFGQADQLTGAVQWDREPAEGEWWAARSGELITVGSPGEFRLTRTPRSVTCQELIVSREPEGALAVGAGEESWVVRSDGVVLTARAIEEGFEHCTEQLERGLQKMSEFSGARAPVPVPAPASGSWLGELMGELGAGGALAAGLLGQLAARAISSAKAPPPPAEAAPAKGPPPPAEAAPATCPECQHPLTSGARFCAQCGHKLSAHPTTCPSCQAPTPPEMRFCAQCGQRLTE